MNRHLYFFVLLASLILSGGYLRRAICGLGAGAILYFSAPGKLDAAVAPSYERVRQFSFVMSAGNEAAAKLAAHGLIDRIEREKDGTFRFWSGPCFVPATVAQLHSNESPPLPGTPTDYEVSLGDVQCQ